MAFNLFFTYIHTYIHLHKHTQGKGKSLVPAGIQSAYCVYTYKHTYTHTHTYEDKFFSHRTVNCLFTNFFKLISNKEVCLLFPLSWLINFGAATPKKNVSCPILWKYHHSPGLCIKVPESKMLAIIFIMMTMSAAVRCCTRMQGF
jgi:hypothetical protein